VYICSIKQQNKQPSKQTKIETEQKMTTISLDPSLAKKLDQGMRAGESAELPFPVVYVWALNGQASYRSQGGALYYGGWACKSQDLHQVAEQKGISIPLNWQAVTISSRDGGEFEAYTSRNIVVAPVGKRLSWLLDGKRYSTYIDGGRRHLQALAYLADIHSENGVKDIKPWGPVVLTAKGYQARNLLEAFSKWEKVTSPFRQKVAPGVPAWCFYMSVGTFGKDRQAVNVGKPGAQSPITPISAFIPEHLSSELVESLFVGNEVAVKMADLQDQSSEWLSAWKDGSSAEPIEELELGLIQDEEIT
jgi:rhodanese-related sulfurtransferase